MAAIPGSTAPVLPHVNPDLLGFDTDQLARLYRVIDQHRSEGRYPGAQVALARHGTIATSRSFGQACIEPKPIPSSEPGHGRRLDHISNLVHAAIEPRSVLTR